MNEMYAEAGVKRRSTPGTYAAKGGLIFAVIFLVVLSLITGTSLFIPIAGLVVLVIIYLFPRLNIEYEYVFCDGQLDFDKIMGGAKRKTVLRIDFDNVEIVAPKGSHALDSYQQLKVKDFSSYNPEVKPYVIVTSNNGEMLRLYFEPSEKMLEVMKLKAPRKIVNY